MGKPWCLQQVAVGVQGTGQFGETACLEGVSHGAGEGDRARVLVTGGAGYIGSHTVLQLIGAGHEPVIGDDFSNSDRAVVGRLAMLAGREIAVHEVNLTNHLQTLDLMASGRFDAVIHFAGHKAVGESVAQPLSYYDNNLRSTLSLLTAMRDVGPRRMVFSSSATVYGPDATSPLREGLPLSATSRTAGAR